ncbi:hypothetical protein [Bacillus canaveralius]|nr:hypothetical protein [Bacillus canaveralius]
MEALIQAQQAAMYAAIVGASVAITGSGDTGSAIRKGCSQPEQPFVGGCV